MDLIFSNMAESLVVAGLIMLAIEIAVLGFATFILFFLGLAAVLAGILMFLGVIPETLMSATLTVGIVTGLSAVFLWEPLKSIQKDVDNTPAKSDLVGHSFTLTDDVSTNLNPEYHYSGIHWKLKSDQLIPAGSAVRVTKVEVGLFYVEPDS